MRSTTRSDSSGNARSSRSRRVARAVIYGLMAALILIPAVTLLTIGVFRLLTIIAVEAGTGVWAAWTGLGGIFLVVGLFCWTRRNP